jgi:tape measure domain-containing protein
MTTITALNVRLGMDASNFSAGADLARTEVNRVASIMRQSVPPAEKFKQELDLLNKAFSDTGRQTAQYTNAVEMLTKKHQQGQYSAEAIAKAQAEAARTAALAAEAARRQKDEIARLAEVEKQRQAVMEKGKAVTQSVEKAQESHNRRLREYKELLKAGAIDQETFRRAVERSNKTLKESGKSSIGLISSIKGMAAAYISLQTVAKSINLASQVEDATIAFEVLTGSAQDGKVIFEQIRQFAAASPVTFSGATEAAKTMMSFGIAAQDVQKNLQMLSDVTGGNNERFKMLALAFSQMSAAGRLMGQDVLQMINAGFNPLQQISKTTGESMIELKKRMEDGGISSQEVRKAFEDATSAGGMFEGMTDRLSQTVSGKLNIALSDLEQKLAKAGEAMAPLLMQMLDIMNNLKPILDILISLIDKLSTGLGYSLAVLRDVVSTLKKGIVFGDPDRTETDKFLDMMQARADAAKDNTNLEFAKRNDAVDGAKQNELRAAREVAAARMKAIEEQKKAAEQAAQDHIKQIENQRKARLKAIEDARKAQERARQQAEEAFDKELENARQQAMQFFADREKQTQQRREEVAKGPGAGMEVGSSEAVKFAADAINRTIAKTAVPDDPVLLQRDVATKTAQILMAQREANERHKVAIELAKMQLAELKENGFRRIR